MKTYLCPEFLVFFGYFFDEFLAQLLDGRAIWHPNRDRGGLSKYDYSVRFCPDQAPQVRVSLRRGTVAGDFWQVVDGWDGSYVLFFWFSSVFFEVF